MNASASKQDFALLSGLFHGESAPLTFTLDGTAHRGVPASWNPSEKRESVDANIVRKTVSGRDPESGLLLTVTEWRYRDFPVVEWMAEFANDGAEPSPILENVRIGGEIDGEFRAFVHGNGDTCRDDGYEWFSEDLKDGGVTIHPNDGTSCNGAFPYMKLIFEGAVLRAAVGWPHAGTAVSSRALRPNCRIFFLVIF